MGGIWIGKHVWWFIHTHRYAFAIVTTPTSTSSALTEDGTVQAMFPTTRVYRDWFVWAWRRPTLAVCLTVLALWLLFSVAIGWSNMAPRIGALIVAIALFNSLNSGATGLISPMHASFKPEILNVDLSEYSRKFELVLSVLGTVLWAFGDWITCLFHCGAITC